MLGAATLGHTEEAAEVTRQDRRVSTDCRYLSTKSHWRQKPVTQQGRFTTKDVQGRHQLNLLKPPHLGAAQIFVGHRV